MKRYSFIRGKSRLTSRKALFIVGIFAAVFFLIQPVVFADTLELTQDTDTSFVGSNHKVTAKYSGAVANPEITFTIESGPNQGKTAIKVVDSEGKADFDYLGDGGVGIDKITAKWSVFRAEISDTVYHEWVLPPLEASLTASPTSGEPPLEVGFKDESTGAASWEWDFGDGNSSDLQHPTHTYYHTGTFSATLTVTDSYGNSDSASTEITVTSADAPDLQVWCRAFHSWRYGKRFAVSLKVKNVGEEKVNRFKVKMFLADDPKGTNAKLLKERTYKCRLKPNRRKNVFLRFRSEDSLSGSYLICVVEPAEEIAEKDQTNNSLVVLVP